jgi:hypothetical protein
VSNAEFKHFSMSRDAPYGNGITAVKDIYCEQLLMQALVSFAIAPSFEKIIK